MEYDTATATFCRDSSPDGGSRYDERLANRVEQQTENAILAQFDEAKGEALDEFREFVEQNADQIARLLLSLDCGHEDAMLSVYKIVAEQRMQWLRDMIYSDPADALRAEFRNDAEC